MDILTAIRAGDASREIRISAAKGLIPLDATAMVELLHLLSGDEDEEVRAAVTESVTGLPDRILESALHEDGWTPDLLSFYAGVCTGRPGPLEAVILNPVTPDKAILKLAASVPVALMELIVINQVRILREPAILEALAGNGAINASIRRRINELKFDFFEEKKPAGQPVAPSEPTPAEPMPPVPESAPDLPVEVPVADLPLAAPVAVSGDEGEEAGRTRVTLQQKLAGMDITSKIRLAKIGSREERMQLVKSPNRLICTAAVRSPKITDSEVDSIVQLRNIHEEVLRHISDRREWTRRYSLVVSLVKNPRTPVGIAMKFLHRLNPMDLRVLCRSKDIPEVVRRTGRQVLAKKNASG